MNPVFELDRYTIRRKLLKVFGASFQVFDPEGRQVASCAQKAFKLKEDIRVFEDEEQPGAAPHHPGASGHRLPRRLRHRRRGRGGQGRRGSAGGREVHLPGSLARARRERSAHRGGRRGQHGHGPRPPRPVEPDPADLPPRRRRHVQAALQPGDLQARRQRRSRRDRGPTAPCSAWPSCSRPSRGVRTAEPGRARHPHELRALRAPLRGPRAAAGSLQNCPSCGKATRIPASPIPPGSRSSSSSRRSASRRGSSRRSVPDRWRDSRSGAVCWPLPSCCGRRSDPARLPGVGPPPPPARDGGGGPRTAEGACGSAPRCGPMVPWSAPARPRRPHPPRPQGVAAEVLARSPARDAGDRVRGLRPRADPRRGRTSCSTRLEIRSRLPTWASRSGPRLQLAPAAEAARRRLGDPGPGGFRRCAPPTPARAATSRTRPKGSRPWRRSTPPCDCSATTASTTCSRTTAGRTSSSR